MNTLSRRLVAVAVLALVVYNLRNRWREWRNRRPVQRVTLSAVNRSNLQ